jgi:hypothetical protein
LLLVSATISVPSATIGVPFVFHLRLSAFHLRHLRSKKKQNTDYADWADLRGFLFCICVFIGVI